MGNQLELLEAEALKLTAGERAAFAQLLLASLDEDTEIEEAWAAETERRIADIERSRSGQPSAWCSVPKQAPAIYLPSIPI